MYRDDYIMRMIRRFGQVIAYIAGLRQEGRYPLALLATDEALRNALGVGSEALAQRSEREILALIRFADREGSWRELAAYVAAIFHAEAAIYEAQGDQQFVAPRALLALQLLLEAELAPDTGTVLLPFAPPRAHLLELLQGYALPVRTSAALFQLYEREGAYARAEDTLFTMLADAPEDGSLRDAGVAFYRRLLALDDDALAAGGLSRAEVQAALSELAGSAGTHL
ncbi:MAG: DUF6483 family protein [Chloroflexi bacterium OHK40]